MIVDKTGVDETVVDETGVDELGINPLQEIESIMGGGRIFDTVLSQDYSTPCYYMFPYYSINS